MASSPTTHWLDRLTASVAPIWTIRRQRARIAGELIQRHYEAAAAGHRTQGWTRASSSDANAAAASGGGLGRLREVARDLVRNNSYAESALSTIVDHAVGWGIVAKPSKAATPAARNQATARWTAWADTTACDTEGRLDFAGLQKQVMRAVAQDGEVLVRRRWRRPEDRLPIPLQLQVIEADYLDSAKDGITTPSGGRIIQGIEYDPIGRLKYYWLFRNHPGASLASPTGFGDSVPIAAEDIIHVFKPGRPGQVRGASWFAPVILKLKDFDEYEDAALMKQKIAACLAVITSDIDGTSSPLGTATSTDPGVDTLGPGMIINAAAGRSVTVVDPPAVSEHAAYSQTVLRAIATGLGVTYEDLTGDYAGMPFSAARMSRLRHWARVEDWRWRMLIPQLCDPVWRWAMQAAIIGGMQVDSPPAAEWTAPPAPMIEPEAEARGYQTALRIGAITWPDMIRERGYDPDVQLAEIAEWNKRFDKAGVIFDSDPRMTSQAGQPREAGAALAPATLNGTNGNGAH